TGAARSRRGSSPPETAGGRARVAGFRLLARLGRLGMRGAAPRPGGGRAGRGASGPVLAGWGPSGTRGFRPGPRRAFRGRWRCAWGGRGFLVGLVGAAADWAPTPRPERPLG